MYTLSLPVALLFLLCGTCDLGVRPERARGSESEVVSRGTIDRANATPLSPSQVEEASCNEVVWPWKTDAELRARRVQAIKALAHFGTMNYEDGSIVVTSQPGSPDPLPKITYFRGAPTDNVLLESLRYLPELKRLQINIENVSQRGLNALLGLKCLEYLILRGTQDDREKRPDLTAQAMKYVGQHQHLSELALQWVRVTDAEFAELRDLKKLRSVWLRATDLTPKCFETIASWPSIHWVGISDEDFNTPIDNTTYTAIASLDGRLSILSFGEWGESKIHPSMIPAIAEIQSLERLEIGDPMHLTAEDLESLKQLTNLTHFEPNWPPGGARGKLLQELSDAAQQRALEEERNRAGKGE